MGEGVGAIDTRAQGRGPLHRIRACPGAVAPKTPVDTAGTGDAAHLFPPFAFERRCPGHKLEAETIVDHRETAGGQGQPLPVNSRNRLACFARQVRKPCFLGQTPSDVIEFAPPQGFDQAAAKRNLFTRPAGETPLSQRVDPPIERGADLGAKIGRASCRERV